jgi:hypothetical protein
MRRPSAPIRIRSPPMSTISVPPVNAGGAIGVVGTLSSLRFRPTAATESGNRRASRLGRQWLNDLLRRRVQEHRERAERERIRAEAARLATIEERCLKLGRLGRATTKICVPTRATRGASRYSLLPERSRIKDVNGAADLPGSFETRKRK